VAYLALQQFNGMIFGEKNFTEHKMSVLIFVQTFSETLHILRRIRRDIIIHVHRTPGKVPVILV